jgi:hypothetical protein
MIEGLEGVLVGSSQPALPARGPEGPEAPWLAW